MGRGTGVELWYEDMFEGNSFIRPKSETLHVSPSPTRTLRAAKSCTQQ